MMIDFEMLFNQRRFSTPTTMNSLSVLRIILLTLLFLSIPVFIMFDHHRVQQDFFVLKSFLNQARYSAIETKEKFIIRFHLKQASRHHFDGSLISSLSIPTLYQVNYDTTLGDDMIVFSPTGTHEHNIRIHGGDIRLRSWLRFGKNLTVNCNGFVSEGVYPED
jgi:hypothetical protein